MPELPTTGNRIYFLSPERHIAADYEVENGSQERRI
jgi:hypothetical protein